MVIAICLLSAIYCHNRESVHENKYAAWNELVRNNVEETLNGLLDQEAQQLTNAAKYERSQDRQGYRSGHYSRNLTTTSGRCRVENAEAKGRIL